MPAPTDDPTADAAQAADPQAMVAAIVETLIGPGCRFEMVVEEVLGVRVPVMKNRDRSLGEVLEASLAYGDRDYLVTETVRMSYAQHGAAVAALAVALRDRYGVGEGDRVGILAANAPEWLVTFWAAQALGAIAVAYNSWWTPREVQDAVERTTPTVMVVDAKRAGAIDGAQVLTIESDLPAIIDEFAGTPLPHADVDEDDPAVILFTSGTSGRPKGVVHSHRNLVATIDYHRFNDALAAAFAGRDPNSTAPSDARYMMTSPLFHIASLHNLAIPRLATGSAVIMYQGAFDVERVLRQIEAERVTQWAVVPTMATRLLAAGDLSDYDLTSLTSFALASAPSAPALQERLREQIPFAEHSLVDSYGQTECSTAISVATPQDLIAYPGTLGHPIIGVEVQIRDAAGNPVPDRVEGEICTRSAYVMNEYWNDPQSTASALSDDRWLRTGDFGMLEDGRVRLTGRRSDLILRGGENVYPVEVEQVLDEHSAVLECAVIGVDHPDLGQEVAAVVVVEELGLIADADLEEFARERLAYFKVPTKWRLTTESLRRNATGKIMRKAIVM